VEVNGQGLRELKRLGSGQCPDDPARLLGVAAIGGPCRRVLHLLHKRGERAGSSLVENLLMQLCEDVDVGFQEPVKTVRILVQVDRLGKGIGHWYLSIS